MNKCRTAIILGLAALAGGCTVAPRHEEVRVYQHDRYVVRDRHVVHEHDAYEGYYYVRIVYFDGVPWYVDEDLHARPVPPHLRHHFRDASWVRSAPPRFSRDPRVWDGYALSRIVYIDGRPYHVDEDRHARPIPSKLRSRFAYESVAFEDDVRRRPAHRERETPAGPGGDAFGRAAERVREPARPTPAARERERQEPPAYGFGDARGRALEQARGREDVRPLPPADDRPHAEASSNGGAFAHAAERVREQSVRQRPSPAQGSESWPAARDDGRMEPGPSAREGQRVPPPVARERDGGRPDWGQPQAAANDRGRGNGAANDGERSRADRAPGRKNGKGRGPARDQETDSDDRRDDPRGRDRRRDE